MKGLIKKLVRESLVSELEVLNENSDNKMKTDVNKISTIKNHVGRFDSWENKVGTAKIYTKPSKAALKHGYEYTMYIINYDNLGISTYYGGKYGDDTRTNMVKERKFSEAQGNYTVVTDEQNEQFNKIISTLLKKAI